MTDNLAALKPCPFCGAKPHRGLGKVQHDQLHGDQFQRAWVRCPSGHASFDCMTEEMAVASWNTRAEQSCAEKDAEIARLREAAELLVEAADSSAWVTNSGMMDNAIADMRAALGEPAMTQITQADQELFEAIEALDVHDDEGALRAAKLIANFREAAEARAREEGAKAMREIRNALEPFALMSSEGVVNEPTGYVTVTTVAEYFHRAADAIAALDPAQIAGGGKP